MSLKPYWIGLLPMHVAHTYCKVGRADYSSCLRASSVYKCKAAVAAWPTHDRDALLHDRDVVTCTC